MAQLYGSAFSEAGNQRSTFSDFENNKLYRPGDHAYSSKTATYLRARASMASNLRCCPVNALEVRNMENEKDRFGETMRLAERAKEGIYFAEQDRQLLEKLRSQLRKVETVAPRQCPKCPGKLEGYTFEGYVLDRCHECGGIWLDRGELEAIVKKISRGPLGAWLDTLTEKIK